MEKVQKVLRFVDFVSEVTGKAVSYFIVCLALVVGYEVAARYLFGSPTRWAMELSAMLFGTFVIIGGAYTLVKGGHVNMDVVYGLFSRRWRAFLDCVTYIVAAIFVGVLLWKGGEAAWRSISMLEHDSTQWGPPIYPFKTMLPIGAFLLFLQLTTKFVRDMIVVIRGKGDDQWKSEP